MAHQAEHSSRILVTGASGFVGRAVVHELTRRGHQVFAGSRHGKGVGQGIGIKLDVTREKSVRQVFKDVRPSAVIHLVGIITEQGKQNFERVHIEGTRHMVEAVREWDEGRQKDRDPDEPGWQPTRYLHMSALGADILSQSAYSWSKGEAEGIVRASGLAWTIFRPSLIFGVGDDFFGNVLRELVTRPPVVPQIGDGSFPFRPISVQDVAIAFATALERPETAGQIYELTGPRQFTFRELLDAEQQALGKNKKVVAVPLAVMDRLVPLMQWLPRPPITHDQYVMLKAGNTASPERAQRTFGLPLLQLQDHLREIVKPRRSS